MYQKFLVLIKKICQKMFKGQAHNVTPTKVRSKKLYKTLINEFLTHDIKTHTLKFHRPVLSVGWIDTSVSATWNSYKKSISLYWTSWLRDSVKENVLSSRNTTRSYIHPFLLLFDTLGVSLFVNGIFILRKSFYSFRRSVNLAQKVCNDFLS